MVVGARASAPVPRRRAGEPAEAVAGAAVVGSAWVWAVEAVEAAAVEVASGWASASAWEWAWAVPG